MGGKIERKTKQDKKLYEYYRKMFLGFILILPFIIFDEKLKGTIWFPVLGILALIGLGIGLYYFIKLLKEKKK